MYMLNGKQLFWNSIFPSLAVDDFLIKLRSFTVLSLNAWRARSPKRESHYKCDTCKYSFSFRRTSFARYLAHPLTVDRKSVV